MCLKLVFTLGRKARAKFEMLSIEGGRRLAQADGSPLERFALA